MEAAYYYIGSDEEYREFLDRLPDGQHGLTDLSAPLSGSSASADLADDEAYQEYLSTLGIEDGDSADLTEEDQGGYVKLSGEGGWTAWAKEPSEATKRAEATKHHLAEEARRDPAPGMSDAEVWREATEMMPDWKES